MTRNLTSVSHNWGAISSGAILSTAIHAAPRSVALPETLHLADQLVRHWEGETPLSRREWKTKALEHVYQCEKSRLRHASENSRRRFGATLVEVMVACLILMIVAVAGAAYLYQSQATLAYQSQKRIALEAGDARLEEIRATSYTNLQNIVTTDYNVHYLKKAGATWQVSNSDPGETANVNGQLLPLTTTVQYADVDGGASSYDYFVVTVSIAYRKGLNDFVTLQSIYSP